METRAFGHSGLPVSVLGFGAGQIGDARMGEKEAGRLLNALLDEGISLIDTARGYGLSEERIGRHISHRRDEFVISTKLGYGIPGLPDWTYATILSGVEEALRRLKTEVIDVAHLHSCPRYMLEEGSVIAALEEARRQGKVKVCAYSGENEELEFAISCGRFGGVMTSVNLFDQGNLDRRLPLATEKGLGIIAKRPLGNAPWRFSERPAGHYCEEYWLRWKKMGLELELPWDEIALRFAAYSGGAHSCIVGTTDLAHLRRNLEMVQKGPLPEESVRAIREAFQKNDEGWVGQV